MAEKKQSKPLNMDQRINKALDLGPMAALYFVVGIDMLKSHIDSLDDDALGQMFKYFRSAEQARANIEQIHKILNNIDDEQTTTRAGSTIQETEANVSTNGTGE